MVYTHTIAAVTAMILFFAFAYLMLQLHAEQLGAGDVLHRPGSSFTTGSGGAPGQASELPTDADVEAHRRSIIQWLLKCRIPERDAEDIAQAVIFGAIRAIQNGRYVPTSKLTTWLYKIAQNHANVYHRSARVRREKLIDPLPHLDSCSAPNPEQSFLARLDIDVLRELKPRHREILEAVADETTPSEYAAQNGLRLSTVYGRLLQARASYRAALVRKSVPGT